MSDSKKWKNFVLKTGLPLEHEVINLLGENGFNSWGEFSYIRPNESGVETEFSVDIWAVKDLENLSTTDSVSAFLLIECKFSHIDTKWLFSRDYSPFEKSITKNLDISSDSIIPEYVLDRKMFSENISCTKGIEITKNGAKEFTIKRGLTQLKYALPNVAKYLIDLHYNVDPTSMDIILPILLTSSDIYVLKKDMKIENFYGAESLDEIADKKNTVIIKNLEEPLVEKHSINVLEELLLENEYLETEYEEKQTIQFLNGFKYHKSSLERRFKEFSKGILVCNLNDLEKNINTFVNEIEKLPIENIL